MALGVIAVGVGLAGCGNATSGQAPSTTVRGPTPVVIPLDVHWAIVGARPVIRVRVGNGALVPVLLDTGSTGLRIYAPAIHIGPRSDIALTRRPDAATFADGTVEQGIVAHARVTVGSMKTAHSVPFALITRIGCVSAIPDCPGSDGIAGFTGAGEYGILGIGLRKDARGLANPLLALPAAYALSWSIELTEAGGALVLRPSLGRHPIARFKLAPEGKRSQKTPRAWKDDRAKVCWAEVDLRGAACEPTLFDTGSTTMIWYGGLLGRSDTSIDRVLVNPGEYIAAWEPGTRSPFWTFTSGPEFSHDTVIALRGGHPLVIAAVQAFLEFDVAYDDTHGTITLYSQGAP